ncbi:MAG: tripartite tricarboxylate transporter substrate binding protein [Proteobacteria bacterium]|nr:tripartite tricarboxylate transporter substrate binding protein [Burkholderiales bacterium]
MSRFASIRWVVVAATTGLASALFAPPVFTQSFPAKPVRVVVPFPPGGSVDVIARLIAPRVGELMGQPLVIDNRSGASGNIGAELVARSAPDGYTLLAHTIPLVANQYLYSKVPYDVLRDFTPICLLSESPAVLVVHPSVPVKSVRELVALAKRRPGALNYASAGTGTNHHIAGELLNFLAGIEIAAVQYKGGGPAAIATLSGEVGITYPNVVAALPFIQSNRWRAVGITSAKRSSAAPDIPTIAEQGVPGYELTTWHGILAPANTPPAIATQLNGFLVKAMRSPELAERFAREGVDVLASTQEQFTRHIQTEQEKWGRLIRERNMKAD